MLSSINIGLKLVCIALLICSAGLHVRYNVIKKEQHFFALCNRLHSTVQWMSLVILSSIKKLSLRKCFWMCPTYWRPTLYNSNNQLWVPDEPLLIDVKCVKARPRLFNRSKIPEVSSDLQTVKCLSKWIVSEETIGHLKYCSNIWPLSIICCIIMFQVR